MNEHAASQAGKNMHCGYRVPKYPFLRATPPPPAYMLTIGTRCVEYLKDTERCFQRIRELAGVKRLKFIEADGREVTQEECERILHAEAGNQVEFNAYDKHCTMHGHFAIKRVRKLINEA